MTDIAGPVLPPGLTVNFDRTLMPVGASWRPVNGSPFMPFAPARAQVQFVVNARSRWC